MFPVEKATIRLRRYLRQTSVGSQALVAQVSPSSPVEPNFRPAMKITFWASGNRIT